MTTNKPISLLQIILIYKAFEYTYLFTISQILEHLICLFISDLLSKKHGNTDLC